MNNTAKMIACLTIAVGLTGCDVDVDKGKVTDVDKALQETGNIIPKVGGGVRDVTAEIKEEDAKFPEVVAEKDPIKAPVAGVDFPDEDNHQTPTPPRTGGNPKVGGAEMKPDQPIATNASNAPNLSILVAALKVADLFETLSGDGPFTVFAPTNDAFDALPVGTVESLLEPVNKEKLRGILLYHVVAAKATSDDAAKMVKDSNGAHKLETISGKVLTLSLKSGKLIIIDENGTEASVTTADVMQSNGIVHVIDKVLMPKTKEVTTIE